MNQILNRFWNILTFRRYAAFFAILGAVFVLAAFFSTKTALAQDIVGSVFVPLAGFAASIVFSLLGKLLSAIISALVDIAQYNSIISQPTVQTTWATMRDFVNMFFVFALLLIAFSTILRFQNYEAKRLLPRLIIYAVLVNFSLTICGLFIDIAQIIMMTFVNAFKDSALNNLTTMTGLLDYGSLQLDTGTASAGEVLAGYALSLIFMIVAIVTIGAMMVMLLVRILMLWILAILSPFAFVLPVIPKAEKYAGQWWSMFSNYVISGPILAFFIWLALTVVGQNTSIGSEIIKSGGVEIVKTKVGDSGFFINFLIAIGMLFAGLMLTASLGGAMGKIAGGALSKMQGYGTMAGKWVGRKIGASGAIGGLALGGIGGIAAGMAVRYGTNRLAQSERGQRFLQDVARFPLIGQVASAGLRGLRRQRLKSEEKAQKKLRRSTLGELGYYANMTAFTEEGRELQSQARDKAPSQIRNRRDMIDHLQGLGEKELSSLSPNELVRLGARGVTDAELRANDNFLALSPNKQTAMLHGLTRPLTRKHQYRYFTEIDEAKGGEGVEVSPNDIVAADMVVKANQVNLTGDKAGSTLGKDLGDPAKTSGVASLLRRGLKDGTGRLAIDFNRLGLSGAGANLIGEDKTKMIPKIMGQLRTEGYAPAQLQSIEQELQKAQSLSLINKTRDKGDARKIIAHEAVHDMIDDNLPVEERKEMWNKITPEKRESLEKSIRANWAGGDKMSEDQVIEEYFANGLTNETRWGDKSEKALKLDQAVRDQLNKKGLIRKVNEGLVTKKEVQKSGTLKTEEEFKKHNEAFRGQAAASATHQTLTEKATEEEAKEEEEEKEKKPTTAAPASMAEVRTVPQVQSVIKQVMESSAKGMPDPKFFRLMFTDLNKTIGRLGSKLSGAQYEQTGKLSKLLGGLQEASRHAQSDNPLIRESAKQEYDVKLEEFKNEYYNITEAPASEQEIEQAIGDIDKHS